jgi:hypothetical protein
MCKLRGLKCGQVDCKRYEKCAYGKAQLLNLELYKSTCNLLCPYMYLVRVGKMERLLDKY